MTFGERIILVLKQIKWSQTDLANTIGTSAPIVLRFEREEIKPSIYVAAKIADALGVTLDYLLGKSEEVVLDKINLKRLSDILQSPDEDKNHIFYALDNLIKAVKLKNIVAR